MLDTVLSDLSLVPKTSRLQFFFAIFFAKLAYFELASKK